MDDSQCESKPSRLYPSLHASLWMKSTKHRLLMTVFNQSSSRPSWIRYNRHRSIHQYPEDARVLPSQWDSLIIQAGILYRKFHYPDGSSNFLQIVLPVKLFHLYIEQLHTDLGHFGRMKTCHMVSRHAYFPGWQSFTGLLVCNCAVCNLHQQSLYTPRQAAL